MAGGESGSHHHFVLPVSTGTKVWLALMALTVVTVAIAQVDFGPANFAIGMFVATVKASLVLGFFMGLGWDSAENRLIFFGSLVFVVIFLALTYSDVLYRGERTQFTEEHQEGFLDELSERKKNTEH